MQRMVTDLDKYLAATTQMLFAEGMHQTANLVRSADARVEETGFDNWNGGTTIWTVYLQIEPTEYARLSATLSAVQEQIDARLTAVLKQFSNDWYNVTIVPKVSEVVSNWREDPGGVSPVVRGNILDGLRIDNVSWFGKLGDVEFLQRIYDLTKLPSRDSRFSDAAGDIWQHRINNEDWEDEWIYSDDRFALIDGPPDIFLKFLSEMVHPVVRPDRNESLTLVQQFNDQLRQDGWRLVEEERIAGRPRFVPIQIKDSGARSVTRARSVADALDAGWMQKEIERLERSVDQDPALAIGTAKELVESCCKSILTKREVEFSRKADLPELTKLLTKELKLVPEGISDEAKGAGTVRLILRNLTALTQYLAELRGMYGSGHGRDGKHRGLEPRHGRLAVGAAVAFIDFVTDTHHRRLLDDEKLK